MASLHLQNSQFMFQYSVPLEDSGKPTRLVYRIPSAPYRVRGTRFTIAAVYKMAPQSNDQRRQHIKRHSSPHRELTLPASSRQHDRKSAPATPSPSPTPPPSPIFPPSTPIHRVRSVSPIRARTPDTHLLESASSAGLKGKRSDHAQHVAPVTRSVSRSSMRTEGSSASMHPSSQSHKRPCPPASGVSLWTRFGIKNGSPTFIRRDRSSSSTDPDCVTAYYESFSLEEIHNPPDLSDDPQLEEGDVYINTVYDSGVHQMWIWTRDSSKIAFWKVAREGDVRDDGRRLSITPKLGLLSWVKPAWCMRQMLKQHKGK